MVISFPNAQLSFIVDADGATVLDVEHDAILSLNSTGAYVWERLQQGKDVDEIVRHLASDTGVDMPVVDRDVRAFLEQLKAKHLLAI